ncbi:hypothetical protein D3C72_1993110 [compost metagenome]
MRVGEDHLLATRRGDVHAGGDHVEAPGTQAGNQRAPLGEHGFHLADAHALEDLRGDFRGFAGDLARGVGEGEGRFVGVTDADGAG